MKDYTEILDLTKKLIIFPTYAEEEELNLKVLNFLINYLKIPKGNIKYYKNKTTHSLVISTKKNTKNFDVIFHAHLDVVGAKQEEFTPFEKNGLLYGRGATDMKGSLTVMSVLIRDLILKKTKKNIALFITTDEEAGGYHGTKYLLENLKYRSNFFISGETTNNVIVTKTKGMLWPIISARGVSVHGAKIWLGENAIEKLYKVYEDIKKIFPEKINKSHWYSTVNLQRIQGGEIFTRVPNYAEMQLDIRYTEEWKNSEEILKNINNIINKYKGVKIEDIPVNDPMVLTENTNSYVKKLVKALKKHTQPKKIFGIAHGTSDSRFASLIGIPAIEFGPIGKNDHHHKEYVEIKSLYKYYDILNDFIASL